MSDPIRVPDGEDRQATLARLRRRRLLLGWSAPVVLAAIVAGCLLLGTAFGNLLGRQDYEAVRYPQAAAQFQAQQRWTGFAEPWKAWFNSGTAEYRAEQYFRATEDLRVALVAVPVAEPLDGAPAETKDPQAPECRVRTNLSLAIEAMGDEAVEVDDHGMAAAHFAEARQVMAPCVRSQDDETSERQQDKEEQARDDEQEQREEPSAPSDSPSQDPTDEPSDPGEDPQEDPEDEPTASPEPTDDPQREELEERNREAERDRREQQEREGGGMGGGQNW